MPTPRFLAELIIKRKRIKLIIEFRTLLVHSKFHDAQRQSITKLRSVDYYEQTVALSRYFFSV